MLHTRKKKCQLYKFTERACLLQLQLFITGYLPKRILKSSHSLQKLHTAQITFEEMFKCWDYVIVNVC